jgi:hypothetical protein
MAVLSNNGRLINSLPVTIDLQNTDQFIVQSTSDVNPNGVTRRIPYSSLKTELSNAILDIIETDPTLKFSGSFYNPDNAVANFYTTKVRNGLTITTGGITVSSGASSFQSITATQFNGPLTGNVNASSILVSGTGNFGTIIVANTIAGNINSSGLSTFVNAQIGGGAIGGVPGAVTINNTPIGNTAASTIKGTQITASTALKSLGNLVVDGSSKLTGNTLFTTLAGSKISASNGITGSLKGTFTGDVFSPTGVKILENGTGLAKSSQFYGTSSYSIKAFSAISASYAFATVPTNKVQFSISSSYASSSLYSKFNLSSSYASSSISSSYSITSSYTKYSGNSNFSISSSFSNVSKKSNTSLYASSSKTSLTSSYVLQPASFSSYTDKLAYYDGTLLTGTNDLVIKFNYPYRFLYFSGSPDPSNPSLIPNYNYLVVDGYRSIGAGPSSGQSALALSLNIDRSQRITSNKLPNIYNYGPEAWNLLTFDSGSFSLQTYKQSYAFTSSKYFIKYNVPPTTVSTFNVAQFINNDIFFWGEPYSYNTAMRDGAIGIGVTAHSVSDSVRKLKARLQIDVFSSSLDKRGAGSWEGTSSFVRDLPAILVRYGSGSIASPLEKTFYVSGSGDTYIGGTLSSSQDVYVGGDLHVTGEIKGVASAAYAKAWVNFGYGYPAGPLVVSSSYNVTSVVRNGTPGDYTISFNTPFSDVNYLMIGTATLGGYPGAAGVAYHTGGSYRQLTQKTTTAVRVVIIDNSTEAQFDPIQTNVVFFGS